MKKVYKILAVLLAISICTMMPVSAETHTYIDPFGTVYEYSLDADENVTIESVSNYSGYDNHVVVPEKVDGYTVVALADQAYASINMIIYTMDFPGTIVSIGDNVFGENIVNSLYAVYYEGSRDDWATLMEHSGEQNEILFDAVATFVENGFEYRVKDYYDGTVNIIYYKGDKNITELNIPTTLGGCIVTSYGNDDPMYLPSAEILPNLEKITFPDTLQYISKRAGFSRQPITEIVLPSNLQSIDYECFHYCTKLKTATIPDSLDKLGYIFKGCTALEDIYFEGTQTEWNAYEIAEYIPLYHPEVTVHFGEESGQCGDVDDNGDIDMNDALKLYQNACGRAVSTALLSAEDINDDGIVNMMDALLLYGMVS